MLELDAGALRRFRDEADLDFAAPVGISFDLPLRADVPAEDDPVRRVIRQHTRPAACAPIYPTVVNVAADARLEDRLGDRHREQVVLTWLDLVEVLDEDAESSLNRSLNNNLHPHGRLL